MKADPKLHKDGTCAQCGGERKHAVPSKYAGAQAVLDSFCSATCCRAWHEVTASPSTTAVRRDKWEHGTDSGYRKDCRCEPCVAAHAEACRDAHQRRKHRSVLREAGLDHGTYAAYEVGCRCASCTSVHGKTPAVVA